MTLRAGPATGLLRAFDRVAPPALRLCALLFPCIFMVVAAAGHAVFADPSTIGTDSSNYYAAGLRLNEGHALYALAAGDRDVPIRPPFWSIPLLSPPPIAVLWRALALLGDVSMHLWWIGSIVSVAATVVFLARRATPSGLLVVVLLSAPLGLTAVSGNANAFLIPALIAVWTLRDRAPFASGALLAVAVTVKLSPVLLAVWFLMRPWRLGRRGLIGVVGGGLGIGVFSLLGAGLPAHLAYLDALRSGTSGAASPLSIPGLLGAAGAPEPIPGLSIPVAVALGVLAAFVLRRDERRSFTVLAVVAALATPAVYFQTIALVIVGLAPWLGRASAPEPAPVDAAQRATSRKLGFA